jgi:hypothetical protein
MIANRVPAGGQQEQLTAFENEPRELQTAEWGRR